MRSLSKYSLILSIYATTRGFAFALFESPLSPVDWGVHSMRRGDKNGGTLNRIGKLLESWRPDAVVIEDAEARSSRRSRRIRGLYQDIERLARDHASPVFKWSREHIRMAFSDGGASTKQDIAEVIARIIPAFEHRLPRPRRPWESEDSRMWLFDAAALALTFYQNPRLRMSP